MTLPTARGAGTDWVVLLSLSTTAVGGGASGVSAAVPPEKRARCSIACPPVGTEALVDD